MVVVAGLRADAFEASAEEARQDSDIASVRQKKQAMSFNLRCKNLMSISSLWKEKAGFECRNASGK
jgi:hypothetical protein